MIIDFLTRLSIKIHFNWILLTVLLITQACTDKPQKDALCTYIPLPSSTEVKAGQGALQVDGIGEGYFYIFDADGKQLNYQLIGKVLGLDQESITLRLTTVHMLWTFRKACLLNVEQVH